MTAAPPPAVVRAMSMPAAPTAPVSFPQTSPLVIRLADGFRDELGAALAAIPYPEHGYRDTLARIRDLHHRIAPCLPALTRNADLSRAMPAAPCAIKLVNLPQSASLPMPPQGGGRLKRIEKPDYVSETLLLLISCFFGTPYTMACEGLGLVNNLIPSQSTSSQLTGLGADSDLRFHIENAALRFLTGADCSPKALLLHGLRQDARPPHTRLSDARLALSLLDPETIDALTAAHFRLRLPYRWRTWRTGYDRVVTPRIPLVAFDSGHPIVHAAFYGDMLAACETPQAERAAEAFEAMLEAVACDEIVSPGEMLIIDNRVTLHARTPFPASFDDDGRAFRWVQRTFVTNHPDAYRDDCWHEMDDGVFDPVFSSPHSL